MKATFMVLKDSIVLSLRKGAVTVSPDHPAYKKVRQMIRENNLSMEEMESLVDLKESWEEVGLELKDNLLYPKGEAEPLPLELSNRILDYRSKDLPMTSLLNFWHKLQKNPSFNSRKMLFKFLETNQHPFTEDGDFLAYRSVTEDFKDFHTRTFDNTPGSICSIDRKLVDDNPKSTCSTGLHVAAWKYASEFGNTSRKLIEVFVSPEDVVCVPEDYNGTKMRVCKYKVMREVDAPIKNQTIYGTPDPEPPEFDESHEDEDESEDESEEDSEYSTEMIESVSDYADQYEDRYQGVNLAQRIKEETSYDLEEIQAILDHHRHD